MTESPELPTECSSHTKASEYSRRVGVGVAAIALAGVVLRAVMAYTAYPLHGDTTYSYCYRAGLIGSGDFAGVFLMWHPPGYPLLLAPIAAFGISPYLAGVLINLVAFVLLVAVVDRFVAARAWHPVTRLTAAAFIAFQETLFGIGSSPVTEPVYVLLIYLGLLLLIRPEQGVWRSGLAGLLFGIAITVRIEGVLLAAGALFALVCQWLWSRKEHDGLRSSVAIAFAVGVVVGCGWMFANVSYVRACFESQQGAYTIPPASGVRGLVVRGFKCGYHAMTVWLPLVMLLPFWIVVGAGLAARPRLREGARTDWVLLCLISVGIFGCAWTVMHKRIGSFILPAAAIWFALGVEYLAARFRPGSSHAAAIGAVVAIAVLLLQAGRVLLPVGERTSDGSTSISTPAARLLAGHVKPTDPVWAFGSEPEIYCLARSKVVYPFFTRQEGEVMTGAAAGDPGRLVDTLRKQGFRFLVFALTDLDAARDSREPQRYFPVDQSPRRGDLMQLMQRPADFGLTLIGSQDDGSGSRRVYVFAIEPNSPSSR